MRIKEAIVLAGGLGSRLRSAVPDLPKSMAPVAGSPFLNYIITYFQNRGIERFIFSLGYKHDVVQAHLSSAFPSLNYTCVVEDTPLGTGGAIKLACSQATGYDVIIVNGDTIFMVDPVLLSDFHFQNKSDCTLVLKPMKNFDRYGVVEINEGNRITSFKEKRYYEHGLINGGVYCLNVSKFAATSLPEKFSFETDYLEKATMNANLYGQVQDGYFIDIGIPEDLARAQLELPKQFAGS